MIFSSPATEWSRSATAANNFQILFQKKNMLMLKSGGGDGGGGGDGANSCLEPVAACLGYDGF